MKRSRVAGLVAGGLVLAGVAAGGYVTFGRPQPSATVTDVSPAAFQALPQVSAAIPVTSTSRPFLGQGARIAPAGYVETEYFLLGNARTYDWTGQGHAIKAVAGPGRYVTRILVWRPRDPARFSGNVEVTVLNASLGVDLGGPIDFRRAAAQGDVWIGITTKPLAVKALKTFDPVRYAPLDWTNPAAPATRCQWPSIIPTFMIGNSATVALASVTGALGSARDTEDGLVWDMLGQLGQLLKSDRRQAILPGFAAPKVYMTGISQSAIYMRTWIAGFHDRYRTPDGHPVYDGYLGVVGPAMVRINQCASDIALTDPRQKMDALDVPFISLSSEGEMWQARYTHQPDAFTAQGGMVSYEVAGASHEAAEVPGITPAIPMKAPEQDIARSGVKPFVAPGFANWVRGGALPNDFVWDPVIRGAYHNLQLWVRQGIRPPQAPGIAVDGNHEIMRDANGNALGGLRTPYIDVPRSSHKGYVSAGGMGGVMGTRAPLSPATLNAMYPDQAAYVAKFSAATDRLLAGRWISPDDAAAMKAAAQRAPR